MTTDIEITLSPWKKALVTPHSGTFVVHEESRVHLGEPVKDEYSALWRGKIRLDTESERVRERGRRERESGLGQRAVMRLQPLNSPDGKRKVTDSFIPTIANKPVKSWGWSEQHTHIKKNKKTSFWIFSGNFYHIMPKLLFSFYSCKSPTCIKGCIRHERPLLAAEVLTSVALVGNKPHPTQGTMT